MVHGMKNKQKESNVFTVTITETFYKTIFLNRVSIHCLMYICDAFCFIYYFTLRTGLYSGCSSEASYRHIKHRFARMFKRTLILSHIVFVVHFLKQRRACFCYLNNFFHEVIKYVQPIFMLTFSFLQKVAIFALSIHIRMSATVFYLSTTVSPTSGHVHPPGFLSC